ncbi:MAG: hypothetical protein P8L44_03395 [Opitutales bacterium]|jgi:hypothetical protein|nr:hypothetical protein [Opitutales bacterium]
MLNEPPSLVVAINPWTLFGHPTPEAEWSFEERLAAIKEAGFDAVTCRSTMPNVKVLMEKYQLRYGGFFDAHDPNEFESWIQGCLDIGGGPMNCQLADHDTLAEESISLTMQLMETAERLGARVHLEVHRDTCMETPEKTAAIIEGYKHATGKSPLINFDYSHPAVVKHLGPSNYAERLFDDVETFQLCNLWHMRPFNGHHCQVAVTDGKGAFTPEYEDMRPFIRQAYTHWLDGPRPTNELWVVPELGPKGSYGLSSFPCVWEDAIVLGKDLETLWIEVFHARS